jgi:UrcA family protein
MYRPVVILSAVLVAATPNLAPAGTPVPGKAETAAGTVTLAGLDLSTTAGMAQAQKRLTVVAERLCRKFRDDRKAADWATYVDCVHDTLASALEKVMTTSSSIARN